MNSTQKNQSTTIGLTQQTFENESPLNTMEKGGGFLDATFKMTGYRKRRLSKIPSPVIIPPPSAIIIPPSPVSSESDSYFEQTSPISTQSPTKRFVLKPITALTAAFQRTTITGRKSSTLLKFPKSQSNNHPKSPKPTSPRASPQSPKPPKLLHRKGSSGSIRKRSESPTSPATAVVSFLTPNGSQSPTNNSKPSFRFGKSFSLSVNTSVQSTAPKSPSKLSGKFNLKSTSKSPLPCSRKALPIVPSELAERLRESSSQSAKYEDERIQYYYDENDCSIIKPFFNRSSKPILIDVRNLSLYQDIHIRDSFNVNLPTLLIKRYRKGNINNFSLDSFITTPEGHDKYLDLINEDGDKNHDIIIFDETMDENEKVSPGWTLLNVLERAMHSNSSTDSIDDHNNEIPRGRVYWLRGGFEAFRSWDQRGEFLTVGSEMIDNNDMNSMECEGQEQQGTNLVRRDSLFSVNTERSSLRRKKSEKQPDPNLSQQISHQKQKQQLQLQLQRPLSQLPSPLETKPNEMLRGRRESNGLQYLFNPTNGNNNFDESLSLYPTASYGAHDIPPNDETPDTPPPVMHPEALFEVSTIVPGFLYLGPEITKENEVKELEDKGVKRILNMAFECEDCLGLRERFDRYLKLNVKDSVEEDVEKGLKIATDFIERDNSPIYVHCKAGKSRSVTAVLAYLIKSRHWTLKHAYDYVMERRNGISPNIGFVAELMRLEEVVLGIKRNCGAVTGFDLRKDDTMDMEGVEPLSKVPRTAFF